MASAPRLNVDVMRKALPDGSPLFAGLHLTVAPGQVVALVGPSGVGKTSLLRCIAGTDRDYVGAIMVGDTRAGEAPAPGMMFQDPRLLPWLTVLENVRLVAPRLALATAKVWLAELGLETTAGLYPSQLSLGMQRRVALLRALIDGPALLLLDEPFTSLDPERRDSIRARLLEAMERTHPTTILATHDIADAAHLCHRVILLRGRPVTAFELTLPPPPPAIRTARDVEEITIHLKRELEAVDG
jgi:ABC-type nitrate/sulfonate/bicarbonate transport system ATPase subunit